MKKLIFLLSVVFSVGLANGQSQTSTPAAFTNGIKNYFPSAFDGLENSFLNTFQNNGKGPINKTATCIDTIRYPESKLTSLNTITFMNESRNGVVGISQMYNANTGLVHGIEAWVFLDRNNTSGDLPPLDAYIKVTNVNGTLTNEPTTTIDSALVQIFDVGFASQKLMFTTPVPVSGRYAITVELNPATSLLNDDSLFFITNDPQSVSPTLGDGNQERLLSFKYNFGQIWYNGLTIFGFDADVLLSPIFERTVTSSYTTSTDTICLGSNVVFTNTSDISTDYMYNRWDSLGTDVYAWDYDDGSGIYNHLDTTYTYAVAGTYNTELLITNYGYTANCTDTARKIIEVVEPIVTASNDTIICIGDTVFLSATGAVVYTWDNSLGFGQNHAVVPLRDTMYVVTGTLFLGCTDTDTVRITVNPLPTVIANMDTIICAGGAANLSASGTATTYTWDNGLGAGQNFPISPTLDTMYTVTGVDINSCSNLDSVFVAIAPCNCVDTIRYPESKLTAFNNITFMDEAVNGVAGISQMYNANTGFVHGIEAWVFLDTNLTAGDLPPLDVYIKVTNVNASNEPTTTIDSALVKVFDIGFASQKLLFTTPVPVSGNYAITVELNPLTSLPNSDSLFFVTNDPTSISPTLGDGNQEGLLSFKYNFGQLWFNGLTNFIFDADVLLSPIFDKTITSSYTSDVDSLCLGGNVVFTNTAGLDTNYMYNRWDSLNTDPWVWNYDDGTGTYNHYDTTYTFATAGSYNTQLLVTNYGYTANCVDSVQQVIEVLETVVTTSIDTAICLGDTAFISASGATTYTWDNGLGAGQNQAVAPLIDTMYVVTGTGSVGTFACVDTDTVRVTINALPIVLASNDTIICLNDTVFLSATGASTYTWDNSLGAGQNQTANPLIDTMYVVSGTDALGCVNTDTVDVSILALPVVLASNDTIICNGDTVTVSASGAATYAWDNTLGAGQSHQVFPTITTDYIVTGLGGNGCFNVDTAIVTVNALPVLTTTSDTAICAGDSITLLVSGASTYTWDNGLGAGAAQLITSPLDTTYSVIGIDANGCSNNDSVVVTINAIPTVVASNDTTICLGTSTDISVTGATSYSWDNGLGTGDLHEIMPDVSSTYIVSGDVNGCIGTDTVVVTVDNMCFEIPNIFTPNGDGKNDLWNIQGLEIYPNVLVKVLNRWGDLMFESSIGYPEPWDGTYNGTASPSATYYYIIDLGPGEESVTGTINIIR